MTIYRYKIKLKDKIEGWTQERWIYAPNVSEIKLWCKSNYFIFLKVISRSKIGQA